MKFLSLIALSVLFAGAAFAESLEKPDEEMRLLIEPVVGYQFLSRSFPESYTEGMLSYGGRVVYGGENLAGEFEFQYGSSSESFPDLNETSNTIYVEAKLGARKVLPFQENIHLLLRGGLQASRFSDQIGSSGVSSWYTQSVTYEPYVGVGLLFNFFKSLTLTVEETYVLSTSIETSFGFRIFI